MARRFRWPRDSRPIVEVDGRVRTAVREAALSNETIRLARKQFSQAETWEELCELSALFCEGTVRATPGHMGPRCEETMRIGAELAHANRQGFLTQNSQPGEDEAYGQQRAEVCGWARPETAQQLANLVAGTRLHMQVTRGTPKVTDHSGSVDVSRGPERADGTRHVYTTGGSVPGRKEIGCDYNRPDLTDDAYWVTIIDPEWGDHRLLWDRLAQPDWDRPAPPPPGSDLTTTPIETPPDPAGPGRPTWRVRAEMAPLVVRAVAKAVTGTEPHAEMARIDELMREPRSDAPERVHIAPRLAQPDWDNPSPPAETPMPKQQQGKPVCGVCGGTHTSDGYVCPTGIGPVLPKYAVDPPPDVKVHHTNGCRLCGDTGPHTHTQDEWRAVIDETRDNPHSSSLWWLDGVDLSQLSFTEVTNLAGRAGDLRDEMQRMGDSPERVAEVDREYQRLLEAQAEARRRMNERRAGASSPTPTTTTSTPAGAGTGGSTGMSDASSGNAKLVQCQEHVQAIQQAAQQIAQEKEQLEQLFLAAVEESQQPGVSEAHGAIQQINTDELVQQAGAAGQAIEAIHL